MQGGSGTRSTLKKKGKKGGIKFYSSTITAVYNIILTCSETFSTFAAYI